MDLPKAVGWAKGHRNALVVVACVLLLAGVDLLVNRPEGAGVQWFSLPLLAAGTALLALLFWPTAKPGPRAREDTLARRLLSWATWNNRLVPFLPLIGIAIVAADVAYNLWVSRTPQLLTHDQAAILLGVVLVVYRFVPVRYDRERDFVLLFAGALVAILVVPLLVLRIVAGNVSVDAYSAAALAPQTSAILNLLGVPSQVLPPLPPDQAPGLQFTTAAGSPVTVYITSACSGVYSFAIFASAFTAYALTEQRHVTRRMAAFFALGILLAYMANVLRMVVIVLIGYKYDAQGSTQALLFAHSNAGWIIFLVWIAIFWALLFRFLPPEATTERKSDSGPAPRRGAFCGICGVVLTPAIPATRCTCGKFYHVECLAAEGRCPNCDAPPATPAAMKQPA